MPYYRPLPVRKPYDETAQRAVNTPYVNNEPWEITVAATISSTANGAAQATVDGIVIDGTAVASGNDSAVYFDVAPGVTYEVGATAGTPTLVKWIEYRQHP